jgi:hypothetical protein
MLSQGGGVEVTSVSPPKVAGDSYTESVADFKKPWSDGDGRGVAAWGGGGGGRP